MPELQNPLGMDFIIFELTSNVVSCEEAATAKNIPLLNELKSLILTTSAGPHILNLPGDKRADLHAIKRRLAIKEAHLASGEMLRSLNVRPGTVCPFLKNLWSLPQLISQELLHLSYVSTNSGELNKYIIFDPMLLSFNENAIVGNFTKLEGSS